MKRSLLWIGTAALVLLGGGCATVDQPIETVEETDSQEPIIMEEETQAWEHPGILADEEIQNKQVRITTEKGDIVFELYADTAPLTVSNMVYLTNDGYYDGLTFHRREEGFVIQGGDPSGNGTGGPGYTFADELEDEYSYDNGVVAMANRGPNTNGSQFFIMLDDYPLPKAYTIFGKVTEGLEIVADIKVGDEMTKVVIEDVAEEAPSE
jgi:peptidyl-prolyl cis-trans isomerase B (cyclophilin B)